MIRDVAAKRYAEAAYLIAREDGKEDAWLEGLATMATLFGDADAQLFLRNSRVPPADKAQLVEKGLAGLDPLVVNLGRLLLRRGKTALGPQIREAFQELVDQAKGISHATVTSAVPLSDDDVKAVTQKLTDMTGGPVVVDTEVDEGILGGLVVRIGDRLIDGSTKKPAIGTQAATCRSAFVTDKALVKVQLDDAWEELKGVVGSLPPDELETPGVVDDWSVKDLLGHIAFWSGRAARHLDLIAAGRVSDLTGPDGDAELNEWNAREASARKGETLEDMKREWMSSFDAARRALEQFPEEKLDMPLWDNTVLFGFGADTFVHYKEHAHHLREWAKQLGAKAG